MPESDDSRYAVGDVVVFDNGSDGASYLIGQVVAVSLWFGNSTEGSVIVRTPAGDQTVTHDRILGRLSLETVAGSVSAAQTEPVERLHDPFVVARRQMADAAVLLGGAERQMIAKSDARIGAIVQPYIDAVNRYIGASDALVRLIEEDR